MVLKLLIGVAMFHDKSSISVDLRCGVPPGTIVGPLLFLPYIINMLQALGCDLFL